jgi:GxxExxY protein
MSSEAKSRQHEMDQPQRHGGTEFERINNLTERIIGAAIEVHRALGPGLLEGLYETALAIELDERRIKCARQVKVPASYKGRSLGDYVVDLIVEDLVVVEVKSIAHVLPVFEAQLISYLRLTGKRLGLLINFNTRLVKEGIIRRAL